jgi:hypothetical protein
MHGYFQFEPKQLERESRCFWREMKTYFRLI